MKRTQVMWKTNGELCLKCLNCKLLATAWTENLGNMRCKFFKYIIISVCVWARARSGTGKPHSDLIPYSILIFLKMRIKTHTTTTTSDPMSKRACILCWVFSSPSLINFLKLSFAKKSVEKKKHALRDDEGPSNGQHSRVDVKPYHHVLGDFQFYAKLCFPIAAWLFVKSSYPNIWRKKNS